MKNKPNKRKVLPECIRGAKLNKKILKTNSFRNKIADLRICFRIIKKYDLIFIQF